MRLLRRSIPAPVGSGIEEAGLTMGGQMNRLKILLVLLFGLCTYPVASARAYNAFALPGYVVAPYQVCVLAGFPIFYSEIEKVHRPHQLGLTGTADVLKGIGFSISTEQAGYNALLGDEHLHIIQDERGRLLVIEHKGWHLLAFDYPFGPIEFKRSMVKNWPTPVVTIDKVPTRKFGRSPLTVTPQLHDFGVADAGNIVTTAFDLWNPSNQKVTLLGMQTSCGCTVMDGKLGSIAPGEHRQFVVKFNSIWKWGYGDWTCVIDTDKGPAVFLLSGYVRSAEDYFPHQIAFGDIVLGKRKRLSVRFLERGQEHSSPIVDVSAPKGLRISVTRSIDPYWHTESYLLNIAITPDKAMMGRFSGAINVKYKAAGELRDANIPVSAFVRVAPMASELHVIRNVVPNAHEGTLIVLNNKVNYDSIKRFKVDCPSKCVSVLKRRTTGGRLILDVSCRKKVASAVAQVTITSTEHNLAKRLVVVLVISSR